MKKILLVISFVSIIHGAFLPHLEAAEVKVFKGVELKNYAGHYELVKKYVFQRNEDGKILIYVTMRNLDDKSKPLVAFVEESLAVNAEDLKNSSRIEVTLSDDKKHMYVIYFDGADKPFFISTLVPF